MIANQRVTIIRVRKFGCSNINEELMWFGTSLGLFGLRDKDKSCYRIFIELLKNAKVRKPVTSDDLASHLDLSRGTIIHHINNLMEAGLVVHQRNSYYLRVDNLEVLIDELDKDIKRVISDLRESAKKIDQLLGI